MINLGDLNTMSLASGIDYASQNFVEKAINTTGAAVVDLGTSIWNSIVPESTGMEISTRKLLQDMGATGALSAYENNKDTVQAMSFIGGLVIPGGAALKLVKGVRAGLKGTSFLSNSRHVEDLAKYESLIADGLKGTAEYKKVRNSMLIRSQANNLLDTAATEVAIMGAFNAHPYMEDYMEDPIKNFGISLAIGGGIGAGITGLISRSEIKAVGARVATDALDNVNNFAKTFDTAFSDTSTTLAHLNLSAGRLEAMAKMPEYNGLTKQIASEMASNMRIRMGELASSKMSTEMNALSTEAKNAIAGRFTDLRFLGADRVRFYKPIEIGEFNETRKLSLRDIPIFKKTQVSKTAEDEEKFVRNSFYSPEVDGFVSSKGDANLLTTASDVATEKSIEALAKTFTPTYSKNRFKDLAALERTGDVETHYLAGIKAYRSLKTEQLAKAEIHGQDFPAINGVLSSVEERMQFLQRTIQEGGSDIKKLTAATDELIALNNATFKVFDDAGKATVMDYQQLYAHNLAEKGKAINEAVAGGMKYEVAAVKYNVDKEYIPLALSNPDAFTDLSARVGFVEANARVNRWRNLEQIPEALSPSRRIMHITAQKQQIVGYSGDLLELQRQALRGEAILDRQFKAALNNADSANATRISTKLNTLDEQYATINKLWLESSVAASKSATAAAALKEVLNSGEYQALREGLAQFNNFKGGNPLFQSADMVTASMGEVGRLVTALGDKRVHVANQIEKAFLDPVASAFRNLYTDDAARTEFAIFDNLRLSNKGILRYDPEARTFVTGKIDPKTGALKNPEPITDMTVQNESVHRALQAIEQAANEVYETQVVVNRLSGKPRPASTGFWLPYTNLKNKEYAFVLNINDNTQKLLVANNYDELQDLAKAYNAGPDEVIRFRTDISNEKLALMQDELEMVTTANVGMQKRGIGLAAPDLSPQRLSDIIDGFRSRFNAQTTAMVEYGSFDLMKKLDYLSAQAQRPLTDTNKTGFLKTVKQAQTKDTAADIKDILLGRNSAYRSELVQAFNKPVDTAIQFAIEATGKAFQVARQTKSMLGNKESIDWDTYEAARKANNIPDPYAAFNDAAKPFLLERAKSAGVTDPNRVIRAGNEMASMLALKFGELAQPIVNMLSLPILSTSTINRAIKATNITNANEALNSNSLSIMINGIRRMNSKDANNIRLFEMADQEGLLEPMLSEVDEVMKMSRFSTGAIANLEKAMDSTFVNMMSKPSELAEGLVRKAAFGTGVELAKRIYGSAASDRQVLIYARDYMKQALGNYSTAQRPMMFQGSLGAAMGLFQTYMLTYAQNMYRHIDLKDYKGLGQTMLAQAGIFGTGSLPGFQPISQAIGNNFSDENFDLYTGTYRAIGDDAASILLYGLPSNLGPAVHTRGDVNPRIPTGFETMVAPSMVGQVIGSMVEVGKSVLQQDGNAGQAFFEALSTQSVSRPIARLSELASGYSVTGPGNTIAGPEEVWSWQGILSRVMSTRPLNEAKVRESIHLNSYYGSLDREAKQGVLERLRTAIRGGNLNDGLMDELAADYLRTGTPQGFRQAVNQAFLEGSNARMVDLHNRFGDSPLMLMVDDLD